MTVAGCTFLPRLPEPRPPSLSPLTMRSMSPGQSARSIVMTSQNVPAFWALSVLESPTIEKQTSNKLEGSPSKRRPDW